MSSRIAKKAIKLPKDVNIILDNKNLIVKGTKGKLEINIHNSVNIIKENDLLIFSSNFEKGWAMAGTIRSLVNNMIIGVTNGFEKRLQLIGVGYRGKVDGNILNLTLGFSHPINYKFPRNIIIEVLNQTEIIIKGPDKQSVGQIAAEIRRFRLPEPYKGKGVRYLDEHVRRKEAKKK